MTYLRLSHTVVARADSKVVKRVFQLFLRSQLSKALGTSRGVKAPCSAGFRAGCLPFWIFWWKMLEDVNFFFVAACPWFSVPCERYILQTRVTVGSVLRQVTLLPSRPPLVKQFSGRQFFSPASWVLLWKMVVRTWTKVWEGWDILRLLYSLVRYFDILLGRQWSTLNGSMDRPEETGFNRSRVAPNSCHHSLRFG